MSVLYKFWWYCIKRFAFYDIVVSEGSADWNTSLHAVHVHLANILTKAETTYEATVTVCICVCGIQHIMQDHVFPSHMQGNTSNSYQIIT